MRTQQHARAKWLTLASVCIGNFLLVVDLFVVTVALSGPCAVAIFGEAQ